MRCTGSSAVCRLRLGRLATNATLPVRGRPGVPRCPQRPFEGVLAMFGLPGDVRGALRGRARAASGVCVEEGALHFQLVHPGDNRER